MAAAAAPAAPFFLACPRSLRLILAPCLHFSIPANMSHSWLNRANALGTFAGTVLAVVCLAVTATGDCWVGWWAGSLHIASPVCAALIAMTCVSADLLHRSHPFVACDFVGTEGLQKEFGHDRVRLP